MNVREISYKVEGHKGLVYTRPALRKNHKGSHKIQGYVRRRVENHPFSDKRGYVSEHRLVMEAHIKRFLKPDEVVHHINGIRDDNRIENLEIYTDQKRHASSHAESAIRDEQSQRWIPDPVLAAKKFRLLNRNTGLMEVRDLSNLINTTFRRGQFEYRGAWTGLHDKSGKEIYEGDILADGTVSNMCVIWSERNASWCLRSMSWAFDHYFGEAVNAENCEVIGNIHEHPELLKGDA